MNRFSEPDLDNLAAVLDYCDKVAATYERIGKSFDCFCKDPDYRDSLLMNILLVGEAANRLSDECREAMSDIPWREIIGTRNIIVHGYVQIDDAVIWHIIEKDLPELKNRIEIEVGDNI